MTTDAKHIPSVFDSEEWTAFRDEGVWINPEREWPDALRCDANELVLTHPGPVHLRYGANAIVRLIAGANDALPDDSPYKITEKDATLVRDAYDELQALTQAAQNWWPIPQERIDALLGLAAKIRALLPPPR